MFAVIDCFMFQSCHMICCPVYRTLPSYSASRSSSRRQRFFTKLHPHLTSPSAKLGRDLCSKSHTWAAVSHPIPRSTKRPITDSRRQAAPSADSEHECGTARTWQRGQRSVYTEPLTPPPFSIALRHGSPTADTSNSLSVFIRAVSSPSSTSTGVTMSPMSGSLNRLKYPASKPCYWSTSLGGLCLLTEGRTAPSRDRQVWRAVNWLPWCKGTKEQM